MLTKTTRAGIQTLLYLALNSGDEPASPRAMATALGCSPTYLSKVTGQLVRAGVLHAHKGAKGGVTLSRTPRQINLLDIVQALQGPVLGDYCPTGMPTGMVCRFHQAMYALHQATLEVLSKWTLADMAEMPGRSLNLDTNTACMMHPVARALASAGRKGGQNVR